MTTGLPDSVEPDVEPRARSRSIVCEFCECKLTAAGEIIKRGERARAMMALDDDNAALRAKVADAETALAAERAAHEADRHPVDVPVEKSFHKW